MNTHMIYKHAADNILPASRYRDIYTYNVYIKERDLEFTISVHSEAIPVFIGSIHISGQFMKEHAYRMKNLLVP